MFKGSCDEDLRQFYRVDPAKVSWIKRADYVASSVEDTQELMRNYIVFLCIDEPDKLFLIPL